MTRRAIPPSVGQLRIVPGAWHQLTTGTTWKLTDSVRMLLERTGRS